MNSESDAKVKNAVGKFFIHNDCEASPNGVVVLDYDEGCGMYRTLVINETMWEEPMLPSALEANYDTAHSFSAEMADSVLNASRKAGSEHWSKWLNGILAEYNIVADVKE